MMIFVTESQQNYLDAIVGNPQRDEYVSSEIAQILRERGVDAEAAYDLDLVPPGDPDDPDEPETDVETDLLDPQSERGRVFNDVSRILHDHHWGVGDYEAAGEQQRQTLQRFNPRAYAVKTSGAAAARNRSDEDVSKFGIEYGGSLNYNFAGGLINWAKIDDMPPEVALAQAALLEMYEELPNWTWAGTSRMLRNLAGDPFTYAGGVAGFKVVQQLIRGGGIAAVKSKLMQVALRGAGISAVGAEGSAYAMAGEYMNQRLKHGQEDEANPFRPDWNAIAAAGAVGFGVGSIAGATPLVPGAVRAGKDAFNSAVEAAKQGDTLTMGVGPVPGQQTDQLDMFDTPGAAPNRTDYSLVRFQAPRGASARVQALGKRLTEMPEAANEFRELAAVGERVGRDWYNTEDLRDKFVQYLGEDAGHAAWKDYLWLVGATSTGSKVRPNLRNASYYYSIGREELEAVAKELLSGDLTPPKGSGYGHKMQRNQAMNVGRYVSGEWDATIDPRQNPKPRGFAQSLMGSERNIAADKHFMRMLGMMSDDPRFLHGSAEISKSLVDELQQKYGDDISAYISTRDVNGKPAYNFNAKKAVREGPDGLYDFIKSKASVWDDMPNDNEYDFLEKFAGEIGREMNMTAPQFQAALWMGAAQRTGVDETSQYTFMQIFNDIVEEKAKERGLSVEEVIRRFVTGEQPLLVPIAAGAGAAGAASQMESGDSSPDT